MYNEIFIKHVDYCVIHFAHFPIDVFKADVDSLSFAGPFQELFRPVTRGRVE
jgi:hypothetical protein